MKKNNKIQGLTLSDFKMYYKAIVNKTVWYWQNYGQIDKSYRRQSPAIGPHIYSQLTFEKGNAMEQRWSFQQMVLEQLDSHMQKTKCRHRTYTLHKN